MFWILYLVFILINFVWKWQIHVCFCVCIWKDQAHTIEWWILLFWFYEGTKRSAPVWAMLLRCSGSNVSFWRLSLYFLPTFFSDLIGAFLPTEEGFNASWTVWSFFAAESSSFLEQKMLKGKTFLMKIDFFCQIVNLLENWQTKPKANRIERGLNESGLFPYHRVVT